MLTKSELKWLEDREYQAKEDGGRYYCWSCEHYNKCSNGIGFNTIPQCPTTTSGAGYKDAAEFEAMVVQEMAINAIKVLPAVLAEMDEPVSELRQMETLVFASRLSAEKKIEKCK